MLGSFYPGASLCSFWRALHSDRRGAGGSWGPPCLRHLPLVRRVWAYKVLAACDIIQPTSARVGCVHPVLPAGGGGDGGGNEPRGELDALPELTFPGSWWSVSSNARPSPCPSRFGPKPLWPKPVAHVLSVSLPGFPPTPPPSVWGTTPPRPPYALPVECPSQWLTLDKTGLGRQTVTQLARELALQQEAP